jgi:ribose 5-phosphate isomerase A
MKQAVATAAVDQIQNGMIIGLGSGSTAALMIEALALKIKTREIQDIVGVTTSFQGEVLATELGIPLKSLSSVSGIDLAIDGADEVDPNFQLIKGGGACHVQEKLVAALAKKFIVVVDSSKLVEKLNLEFKLPVEVLPSAWKQVQKTLEELGAVSDLRMAQKKAGPIVTDQGNLILDLTFHNGIDQPDQLESQINNIPGVLENGLFINLTDEVLVGRVENEVVGVKSLKRNY